MFQNIKVDIIYYKTATDFEMEFNLSGCCRMRLLTDKASDRKILVNQLARAVSRSRIIMIAGSLFGDEGIIKTAATAIGRQLCVVDNNQFGILGDDKIEIIKDAVPLVSGDGIFGGCIIEQGPQTLILLSENKNIRKNIMQNLIHPYVQEVCAAELTEKVSEAQYLEEPTADEAKTESEETLEELILGDEAENTDNLNEEIIVEDATLSGDELIMADEDFYDEDEKLAEEMILEDEDYLEEAIKSEAEAVQDAIDKSEELIFEPEFLDRKRGNRETLEYAYISEEAEAYITGEEEDDEEDEFIPMPPRFIGLGINIPIIIIAVLLLIVVAVLCYSIFIVPKSEGVTVAQYLKDTFEILFG